MFGVDAKKRGLVEDPRLGAMNAGLAAWIVVEPREGHARAGEPPEHGGLEERTRHLATGGDLFRRRARLDRFRQINVRRLLRRVAAREHDHECDGGGAHRRIIADKKHEGGHPSPGPPFVEVAFAAWERAAWPHFEAAPRPTTHAPLATRLDLPLPEIRTADCASSVGSDASH